MKKIKLTKEEDRDQKTLAKQYKRLEIFIIIFMAIAICLGTFYFNVICFGPECENKSPTPLIIINTGKTNTEMNDDDNLNEDETLTEWANYILSSNIQSITLDRTIINETEDVENRKNTVLTKNDLRNIIRKISNDSFTKTNVTGFGMSDTDTLNVTYIANNITYNFKIFDGYIFVSDTKDAHLINLLEKKVTNTSIISEYDGIIAYKFNETTREKFTDIYDKYFN